MDLFEHADTRERRLIEEVARLRAELAEAKTPPPRRSRLAGIEVRRHVPETGAELVSFPSELRRGRVRRAADEASRYRSAGKLKDKLEELADQVFRGLIRAGFPEVLANAEADIFYREVVIELDRIKGHKANGGPNDAA